MSQIDLARENLQVSLILKVTLFRGHERSFKVRVRWTQRSVCQSGLNIG